MKLLPSEVEVRFIIPSLRKEISIELFNKGFSQKNISNILSVTPSAVNQYIKNKRGKSNIPAPVKMYIKALVKGIIENKNVDMNMEIIKLLKISKKCGYLCYIHKMNDDVKEDCNVCLSVR